MEITYLGKKVKVNGPYLHKNSGRYRINILYKGKRAKTATYSRFLMQQYLNRELSIYEEVDHINNNKSDDRIENLQILSGHKNRIKDHGKLKLLSFDCPICGIKIKKELHTIRSNYKMNKNEYFFCSTLCKNIFWKNRTINLTNLYFTILEKND